MWKNWDLGKGNAAQLTSSPVRCLGNTIYAYPHICKTCIIFFFDIHLDLFTGKKRQLRRRRRALNTSLYKRKEENSDRPKIPTSEPSCDNLKDEPEYYCLYYMDGKYCDDCVFDPDTGENFWALNIGYWNKLYPWCLNLSLFFRAIGCCSFFVIWWRNHGLLD